jgi:HK97 gp10 family phage protein
MGGVRFIASDQVRIGDGWKVDFNGDDLMARVAEATARGINDTSDAAAEEARTNHPQWETRTGELVASVQTHDAEPDDGDPLRVRGGFSAGGEHFGWNSVFQEFGTSKMPANPWLYPAYDASKPLMLPAVREHLDDPDL